MGHAQWAALEDNWRHFLWGKCTEAAFAARFQRMQASVFFYSCSMLDYSQRASRCRFVGWHPGTLIEQ